MNPSLEAVILLNTPKWFHDQSSIKDAEGNKRNKKRKSVLTRRSGNGCR